MKNNKTLSPQNTERRIRKHIHAQTHTFDCLVPGGFIDLGMRTAEVLFRKHLENSVNKESSEKIIIKKHGSRVRIENAPFDFLHTLLLEGLIYTEIQIRITRSRCSTEEKLQNILNSIDWELWIDFEKTLSLDLRADSLNSTLYNETRLKKIIREHIEKYFRSSKASNKTANAVLIGLDVLLEREALEIYLSVSGRDYWKRGHKNELKHSAPLREDIAACLLQRLSEISQEFCNTTTPTHIFNPFCGTGTLLHESVLKISEYARLLTGTNHFIYLGLPFFKEKTFLHHQKRVMENRVLSPHQSHNQATTFYGEDTDSDSCKMTNDWFEMNKSKIPKSFEYKILAVNSTDPNEQFPNLQTGNAVWILANPPFGLRLSNSPQGGNDKLYEAFAKRVFKQFSPNSANSISTCGVILCPNESTWRLIRKSMPKFKSVCEHFTLGGLDVRAYYFWNQKL